MVFLVAQDRGFPGFDEVGRPIENVALKNPRRRGLWMRVVSWRWVTRVGLRFN